MQVNSKKNGSVEAKIGRDPAGSLIYGDTGRQVLAPRDFDAQKFVDSVRNSTEGMAGFRTNHQFDLQRSYNGLLSQGYNGFVEDFTPLASWAVGFTAANLGYSQTEALAGGAAVNVKSFFSQLFTGNPLPDVSDWGNTAKNAANIRLGFQSYVDANPYSV